MILDAPFTSAAEVGAAAYPFAPVRWMMKDKFHSDERIGRVSAPLLVLHGERDSHRSDQIRRAAVRARARAQALRALSARRSCRSRRPRRRESGEGISGGIALARRALPMSCHQAIRLDRALACPAAQGVPVPRITSSPYTDRRRRRTASRRLPSASNTDVCSPRISARILAAVLISPQTGHADDADGARHPLLRRRLARRRRVLVLVAKDAISDVGSADVRSRKPTTPCALRHAGRPGHQRRLL